MLKRWSVSVPLSHFRAGLGFGKYSLLTNSIEFRAGRQRPIVQVSSPKWPAVSPEAVLTSSKSTVCAFTYRSLTYRLLTVYLPFTYRLLTIYLPSTYHLLTTR